MCWEIQGIQKQVEYGFTSFFGHQIFGICKMIFFFQSEMYTKYVPKTRQKLKNYQKYGKNLG